MVFIDSVKLKLAISSAYCAFTKLKYVWNQDIDNISSEKYSETHESDENDDYGEKNYNVDDVNTKVTQ